jgi:hypothetical protein
MKNKNNILFLINKNHKIANIGIILNINNTILPPKKS